MSVEAADASSAWTKLTGCLGEVSDLDGIAGILEWDQHVWMPAAGGEYRGRQKALLARLRHERMADPQVGDWLHALADDDAAMQDPVKAAAVRNLERAHLRATRIPADLVQAKAQATSTAFAAWLDARKLDDPAPFLGPLAEVIRLTREEAHCLDTGDEPYDALLDQYDPGIRAAQLGPLFDRLVDGLTDLLDRIRSQPQLAGGPIPVPVDVQRRVQARVLTAIGFDLDHGRLDEAPHPFTMGIGPRDVRLTTRYNADDLLAGLLGTVHEGGHGMYEQGLPEQWRGTTVEAAASTALHESQSRFWENQIGRSRPFLTWLCGVIADEGGPTVDVERLVAQANMVQPSFIRVEADEVTYNLHIALRMRLERALLNDELEPAELAEAWNAQVQEMLGLEVVDPNQGLLQDVHWGAGLIGYFPSYTLGNLYAAAIAEKLEADLPDLWSDVARGEHGPTLAWLREHVHRHGHLQDGAVLVEELTDGRDLVAAFLGHLQQRHGGLYGV